MELNSFVFPAPKFNWLPSELALQLIFVPRHSDIEEHPASTSSYVKAPGPQPYHTKSLKKPGPHYDKIQYQATKPQPITPPPFSHLAHYNFMAGSTVNYDPSIDESTPISITRSSVKKFDVSLEFSSEQDSPSYLIMSTFDKTPVPAFNRFMKPSQKHISVSQLSHLRDDPLYSNADYGLSELDKLKNLGKLLDQHSNPLQRTSHIPALYLRSPTPSDSLILYFHANGEDIHSCSRLCRYLSNSLFVSLDCLITRWTFSQWNIPATEYTSRSNLRKNLYFATRNESFNLQSKPCMCHWIRF